MNEDYEMLKLKLESAEQLDRWFDAHAEFCRTADTSDSSNSEGGAA